MKKNNLIIFLVSIFIFVAIWVGFNIYHNSVTSTISDSVNTQLSPISPSFDTKTINNLKKRQNVIPLFQSDITSNPSISPTPTGNLQIISSDSAKQATSGGTLSP